MKRLRILLIVSFAATLAACGGALNPAAPNLAASSARSHAFGAQNPAVSGYKQLYIFKGTPDGASPYSGFIALNGTLYGTTLNGSKNYCSQSCGSNNCYLGCGTVFSVSSTGKESIVYNFKGNFNSGSDGSWPFAGLTMLGGTMYGVASSAGAHQHGAVFTVNGAGSESVIYSFAGGNDGEVAEAPVIAFRGKLYGTTVYGGGTGCGGAGCGTVYSVTTGGSESVLYSFKGGSDGQRAYAPVTEVDGKLYGATLEGGQGCGSTGCGTIFSMTLTGKERVIYRFGGTSDGAYPNGLTAVSDVLYGTTEGGGTRSSGTFFSITPSGTLKTLYNFTDIPDGNLPGATLIHSKGAFYGTTVGGGTTGNGTVFKVTPGGTETVLHSFAAGNDGSDAQGPVYLFNRWLYGTTTKGGGTGCGGNGCGTVFKVKP
ncbi:MAG TPA: choice-of-anchor tandem repeat GloVer-containing protein [Candidatus Binatia bacterium]|nr:choice-of-anchor tandem repeat GloVer-containing protein [Candidatus Binatia bacterium]